jgi:hypothetical protein
LSGKCSCLTGPQHFEYVDAELIVEDQVDHDAMIVGSEKELAHGALRVGFVVWATMSRDEFEHAKHLGIGLQGMVG